MIHFPPAPVIFDEEEHRYYHNGNVLTSVTQLLRSTLFPKKYDGVDKVTLANAAKFGSAVHKLLEIGYGKNPAIGEMGDAIIEIYGNVKDANEHEDKIISIYNFSTNLLAMSKVEPLANEYVVTDGRIAGSIDMIADVNGEPAIVDYKFTYDADIEYLSWQESIYAYLFYKMTGQRIGKAYALWVPKRDASLGWFNPIPMKSDDEIENLISGNISNKEESYPVEIKEAQMALANILIQEKEIAERKKMLQATLHKFMENNAIKQIQSDYYTISYVAPSQRKSLDTKALEAAHPEIDLAAFQKVTNVKSSVKITLK